MSETGLFGFFLETIFPDFVKKGYKKGYEKVKMLASGEKPWFYGKIEHHFCQAVIETFKKHRLEMSNGAICEMAEQLLLPVPVNAQQFQEALQTALSHEIRDNGGYRRGDSYFAELAGEIMGRADQLMIADKELIELHTNYTVRNTQEQVVEIAHTIRDTASGKRCSVYETYHLVLQQLFCDCQEISFMQEANEQMVWNRIIGSFTKGAQVDTVLEDMLDSEFFPQSAYEADVSIFLQYFLARLKLKRGNVNAAYRLLSDLYGKMSQMDAALQNRLRVLLDSRWLAEKIGNSCQDHLLKEIWTKADRIEALPSVGITYKAYEIASFYGRCLTNFAENYLTMRQWDLKELKQIIREHGYLARTYQFANQKIVNISLQWFFLLEEAFLLHRSQAGDLKSHCREGFRYSLAQKNNLFYLQSMLALAIYFSDREEAEKACLLTALSGKIMKELAVSTSHEGVRQLLLFMKNRDSLLYSVCLHWKNGVTGMPDACLGEIWSEMYGFHRKGKLYEYDVMERIQAV